jgi:hypothetical protein
VLYSAGRSLGVSLLPASDIRCRDLGTLRALQDSKGNPLWMHMLAIRSQRQRAESLVAARERLERTAQLAQA